MEWSWRTVLILLGLLAVVLILVDGYRRMRRSRQDQLRLDVRGEYHFPDEPVNPELLGRARVIAPQSVAVEPAAWSAREETDDTLAAVLPRLSPHDDDEQPPPLSVKDFLTPSKPAESVDDTVPQSLVEPEQTPSEPNDDTPDLYDLPPLAPSSEPDEPATVSVIPKAQPVNLDETVPVLLDVDELGDDLLSPPRPVASTSTSALTETLSNEALLNEALLNEHRSVPVADNPVDPAHVSDAYAFDPYPEVESPESMIDPHLDDEVDDVPPHEAHIVSYAGDQAERLADRPDPELVLVIHALARDLDGFSGRDVLFLFNSCDLRFGEKSIFHRFELADGQGCVQFSVAQTHEPGVFDPSVMSASRYHGLSFFLSLPGAHKPLEAYEAMYEMAMVLSRNLGADLLDGEHSALTPQTMEHDRQQIIDFERRRRILLKRQGR